MPPAHPFNPTKLLRLAIALGCTRDVVREIFRFVWRDGRAVETGRDWIAVCEHLGQSVADDALGRADVKLSLRHNTDQAIMRGIFGVPTFAWGDDLFWGEDSTALLLHCLRDPAWLQSDELCRISALPTGVRRNV